MLDTPQNTLPDIWTYHTRTAPKKVVFRCGDEAVTWGELGEKMNRISNALHGLGLKKNDRVAFVMSNTVDYLVMLLGGMKAGACVVPLSTLLSPEQLATLINDSDATILFTDSEYEGLIASILPQLRFVRPERVYSASPSTRFASAKALFAAAPASEPVTAITFDDMINISYSSGTTGLPKGVVYTHRGRSHMGMTYAIGMRFSSQSKVLLTTPLYSNGTGITLWPGLIAGAEFVVMPSFTPRICVDLFKQHKITHTFMVPTQFIRIMDEIDPAEFHNTSLRMCITAGSTMPVEVKKRVLKTFGPCLYELYGFSEGGATIISAEELVERPASVGRPTPGFDTRILGNDDKEVPRGEPGEVAFFGGWMMKGYHNNPTQTEAAIWRDERGRTFVRTGDIGKMDEDGYIYIVDRKKDMIISGGFNVFPSDIEAIVGNHPDVLEATVVGAPHPTWGETPAAFVLIKKGHSSSPEAIMAWANERLGKIQRLSQVQILDEFPRNALGKVVKRDLRDRLAG